MFFSARNSFCHLPCPHPTPPLLAWTDPLPAQLGNFSQWVADANRELSLSPPVEISVLLLDSERFCAACGDTAWSRAVTRKNDLFTSAGKAILPGADVEYYSFGGVIRSPSASGWGQSGEWFTFQEQMDIFAVSLCEPSQGKAATYLGAPRCDEKHPPGHGK